MSATDGGVPTALSADLGLPITEDEHQDCPATDVLRRIGDKWSVLVVAILGRGPRRYNELHRSIKEISQRMLTRTLRGLERDGLVSRTVHPTVPATVEYALTDLGRSLLLPLSTITDWALENRKEIDEARSLHDRSQGGSRI
ncbi:winged helix-turn-helix transcriptional regulator [Nocardiopsis suaedae]|uniref:Helix-turn-helix domain-containing protein n=1 Tax=Nocardiopsis suaedae TaxID=3018444 RepID=A0ABT4TJC4_9ACTN|nr:helix-turn-helix domain-containing protein [Nocardiopsis suaedae]MDA2804804.1 helix-turn-helix domain-containing protein [Nocardiopsis suaedae]